MGLALLALCSSSPSQGRAQGNGDGSAKHPRLVSLESTRCDTCHADLLEGKVVHPPVELDCTTCHDVQIGDDRTRVALMDREPALCILCHDELEEKVAAEVATPHFPVTDSCLTCHDPHSSDQKHVLVTPLQDLCGLCHDFADLQEVHGDQLTDATDCASCHQPHGSDNDRMLLASQLHPPFAEGSCEGCHRQPFGDRIRLRVRGEKLCEACHGDLGEEGRDGGSVHAALDGERGRAGCLSCHDPHMSAQRRLLLEPGPTLCGTCHGEVVSAARAETGHFPAAEDCLNCHRPHASEQTRLLNEPPGDLCTFCHDTGDPDLTGAHLGADLERLQCIQCHTPHGSGNPKLLAENLHPPVEDGCDLCHEGSSDQLMDGGAPDLCLFCHADIGEAAAAAAVPHLAMDVGSCTDCHNPHASAQERLVRSPGAGPCGDCHFEQIAEAGETAHGIVDLIGCRACHEPHGGENPKLLRQVGPDLCLSCHSPAAVQVDEEAQTARLLGRFEVPAAAVAAMTTLRLSPDGLRDHPVADHRVRGMPTRRELDTIETTYREELTCLSCHDPHKGRSRSLLLWNATGSFEACIQCHPR